MTPLSFEDFATRRGYIFIPPDNDGGGGFYVDASRTDEIAPLNLEDLFNQYEAALTALNGADSSGRPFFGTEPAPTAGFQFSPREGTVLQSDASGQTTFTSGGKEFTRIGNPELFGFGNTLTQQLNNDPSQIFFESSADPLFTQLKPQIIFDPKYGYAVPSEPFNRITRQLQEEVVASNRDSNSFFTPLSALFTLAVFAPLAFGLAAPSLAGLAGAEAGAAGLAGAEAGAAELGSFAVSEALAPALTGPFGNAFAATAGSALAPETVAGLAAGDALAGTSLAGTVAGGAGGTATGALSGAVGGALVDTGAGLFSSGVQAAVDIVRELTGPTVFDDPAVDAIFNQPEFTTQIGSTIESTIPRAGDITEIAKEVQQPNSLIDKARRVVQTAEDVTSAEGGSGAFNAVSGAGNDGGLFNKIFNAVTSERGITAALTGGLSVIGGISSAKINQQTLKDKAALDLSNAEAFQRFKIDQSRANRFRGIIGVGPAANRAPLARLTGGTVFNERGLIRR